jgi:hypothetical protein
MAKVHSADKFITLNANRNIAALGEALHATNGIVECDGNGVLSASNGAAGFDTSALHTDTGSEISALTAKAAPVGADMLVIEDSEDTNSKKKLTLTALDGLLNSIGENTDAASASNVWTLRRSTTATTASLDVCMPTGASTYAWTSIVTQDWTP